MAHGARMAFACILVRLLFLGGCEATLMRPPTVCSGSGSPAQGSSPSGYGPARSPWPPGLGPAPYSPSVQCRYFTVTGKCFRGAACPLVHAEGTGLGYLEASWLRPQAPAWGAGSGSGAGAPPGGLPLASAVASTGYCGGDNSRLPPAHLYVVIIPVTPLDRPDPKDQGGKPLHVTAAATGSQVAAQQHLAVLLGKDEPVINAGRRLGSSCVLDLPCDLRGPTDASRAKWPHVPESEDGTKHVFHVAGAEPGEALALSPYRAYVHEIRPRRSRASPASPAQPSAPC